jgi:mannitol/fructose-specific phosphotransferase system IIA component (Ntr-type)
MLIPKGIEYNSVDGRPVKLIFLIISPSEDIQRHLACLSAISYAVSDEEMRLAFIHSTSSEELYTKLLTIERRVNQ